MNRRGFLKTLMAAPFVIRTPGILMPIRASSSLLLPYGGRERLDAAIFYAPYVPLIRRYVPEVIARELCGVQQIARPETLAPIFDVSWKLVAEAGFEPASQAYETLLEPDSSLLRNGDPYENRTRLLP